MARLNAFVPMKPFQGSPTAQPQAYEKYLAYLRAAGAVSSLADSVAYRWMDNPVLKDIYFKGGTGELLPMSSGQYRDFAKKGTPALDEPALSDRRTQVSVKKNLGKARGRAAPNRGVGGRIALAQGMDKVQAQKTFAHETDHLFAMKLIQDLEEKGKKPHMMDRQRGSIIPASGYNDAIEADRVELGGRKSNDIYGRSAHEIRANSSALGDRTMGAGGYGQPGGAVAPDKQVIVLNSEYMQNPNLVEQAKGLFKKLGRASSKALGVAGGLVDLKSTVDLIDNVKKYGIQSDAAFKKYMGEDINDGMI